MKPEDINIEGLILSGALEVAAVDVESGEILYQFTDKLKDIMPELYNEHLNFVNAEVLYFWERGFLTIDDITSDNPIVRVSQKSLDVEQVKALPRDKQRSLAEIMRILKVV